MKKVFDFYKIRIKKHRNEIHLVGKNTEECYNKKQPKEIRRIKMNVQEFQNKLKEIQEIAKQNKNTLKAADIRDVFDGCDLVPSSPAMSGTAPASQPLLPSPAT